MLTESNSLSATPHSLPTDTEHSAQYTVHTEHSAQYTVHTEHSAQYTVHTEQSAQYTVHANLSPLRIFTHINRQQATSRCFLFENLCFQQF